MFLYHWYHGIKKEKAHQMCRINFNTILSQYNKPVISKKSSVLPEYNGNNVTYGQKVNDPANAEIKFIKYKMEPFDIACKIKFEINP